MKQRINDWILELIVESDLHIISWVQSAAHWLETENQTSKSFDKEP